MVNTSMWIKALRVIPQISKDEWKTLDVISRWLIATRAAVFIMTALAAAIGGLLAYRSGNFSWDLFILSLLGIVMAHASNNLLNDLVDHTVFPDSVTPADSMMTGMMNDELQALLQAILVATFLVFLVMAMQFESPRFSFMVMMCIPFALIGSFLLLFITQSTISMVSLMGFLMLMGIVVNNGILFVDSANMLREEGMSTEDALVASGSTRLRPILMTTLTTILSMIPMGLGLGDNGVMMQGMALVIIGGLTASTILTLILIPTFYLIFDKRSRQERRAAKKLAKSQRSGKTGDAENE